MCNNKGLILTITIIFVLILVIMSGVVLLLMSNHSRVTEIQIRRAKSIDGAESAALVKAYEELRTGTGFVPLMPAPPNNNYYNASYLSLNDPSVTVSLCVAAKGNTFTCNGAISTDDLICPGPATTPPQYCVRATVKYLE